MKIDTIAALAQSQQSAIACEGDEACQAPEASRQ
jgi:hypothetical protein